MKKQKEREFVSTELPGGVFTYCYSQAPTEFDVQQSLHFRLCAVCHGRDMEVKSEVSVCCNGVKSRYDLMIFRWKDSKSRPICGIEVKRSRGMRSKKQAERYKEIHRVSGLPTIFCNGMGEVRAVAAEVERYISANYGAQK